MGNGKKIAGAAVVVALCAVMIVGKFYHSAAVEVSTAFEAASVVEDALLQGENKVVLRTKAELDEERLFQVLESIWPYAFTLHCVTYADGRLEVTVENEHAAAQEQAALLSQQIAKQETAGLTDPQEKLRALHDFLVRTCQYDIDTANRADIRDGASDPFTAYGALIDGKAVCAGYARAYVMLCRSAGLDAIYIGDAEMNHSWNAVRLDGETYFIDCTFDDPLPDRGEYVEDTFFLLTAEELGKTHRWEKMFYEQIMDARWGAS